MQIDLNGKLVFISGGTGSVGSALVELFSLSGGKVTFQYASNHDYAKSLERKFSAKGLKLNSQDDDYCELNKFDIIVNNLGINKSRHLTHETSDEELAETINTNLLFSFKIIRQVLPYMVDKSWGRIVNISSIYGLRGSEYNMPYNVSKHGLSGLTKSVSKEYAKFGITCNEICPGPIESELMARIANEKAQLANLSKEDYLDGVRLSIPAKRMANPLEIAYLALFLASDFAGYINGVSIPIDGGLIA